MAPEYLAPWEKAWPKESIAYIRVQPKSWDELEDDEDASLYTYIYEDRVVHIWESNVYDHDGQEEEDEIARAKIIWERLKPAADWFFCHTDGSRIGDGEHIPHHAHIIIGLRDEVDPDWWHKARIDSEHVSSPPLICAVAPGWSSLAGAKRSDCAGFGSVTVAISGSSSIQCIGGEIDFCNARFHQSGSTSSRRPMMMCE
jgi:hypothetical protein